MPEIWELKENLKSLPLNHTNANTKSIFRTTTGKTKTRTVSHVTVTDTDQWQIAIATKQTEGAIAKKALPVPIVTVANHITMEQLKLGVKVRHTLIHPK